MPKNLPVLPGTQILRYAQNDILLYQVNGIIFSLSQDAVFVCKFIVFIRLSAKISFGINYSP